MPCDYYYSIILYLSRVPFDYIWIIFLSFCISQQCPPVKQRTYLSKTLAALVIINHEGSGVWRKGSVERGVCTEASATLGCRGRGAGVYTGPVCVPGGNVGLIYYIYYLTLSSWSVIYLRMGHYLL